MTYVKRTSFVATIIYVILLHVLYAYYVYISATIEDPVNDFHAKYFIILYPMYLWCLIPLICSVFMRMQNGQLLYLLEEMENILESDIFARNVELHWLGLCACFIVILFSLISLWNSDLKTVISMFSLENIAAQKHCLVCFFEFWVSLPSMQFILWILLLRHVHGILANYVVDEFKELLRPCNTRYLIFDESRFKQSLRLLKRLLRFRTRLTEVHATCLALFLLNQIILLYALLYALFLPNDMGHQFKISSITFWIIFNLFSFFGSAGYAIMGVRSFFFISCNYN